MRTTTTACLLLLTANVLADEPVTNATADLVMAEADSNAATSESSMEILRDPFWPVGYEPAPPEAEVTTAQAAKIEAEDAIQAKIRWPALQLKGITRASRGRYMAIVEGVGLIETDQTISLPMHDMLYTWRIDEVSARGVRFTRLEARPYQPTTGVRTQ